MTALIEPSSRSSRPAIADEASASGPDTLKTEETLQKEAHRFRTFMWVLVGLVTLVIALELVGFIVYRASAILLGVIALGIFLAVLLTLVRRRLARRDLSGAALLTGYGLLGCALAHLPMSPTLYPVLAIVPLVVVSVALPFVQGRALGPMLVGAWAASVAMAVAGEFLPNTASGASGFFRLLTLVGMACVVLLFIVALAQYSSRAREYVDRISESNEALRQANKELEAFSYSVSHDLRAPLRAIDGFSEALLEDCGDKLDDKSKRYLEIVRESAQLMGELIDDLLGLSRVTRAELDVREVDLSRLAEEVARDLLKETTGRAIDIRVEPNLTIRADGRLLRIALRNLLENAIKFTRDREHGQIEVSAEWTDGERAYLVRDNGAGFDMNYSSKLFQAFQRLHANSEFAGTGIGLATVHRIVSRHGGRVWAHGETGKGATFRFTVAS
jgi:signal transduction histidine kinase